MNNYFSLILYLSIYTISSILITKGIKRKKNVFILLGIFILIVFAGIRYDVGTDYINYKYMYENISNKGFLEIFHSKIDKGFLLLIKMSSLVGNEILFFSLSSFFIIIPFVYSLKMKYSKTCISLAIFLFLVTIFTSGMNIIRQVIAAGIVFYNFNYIFEKCFFKYMIFLILATLFHSTAVITFPLYFLWNKKIRNINKKRAIIIVLSYIIIPFGFNVLIRIFSFIPVFSRFQSYSNIGRLGLNMSFFLNLGLFLILFFNRRKLIKKDFRNSFFILLSFIALSMSFSGFKTTYFSRLGIYFSYSELILWGYFPYIARKNSQNIIKIFIVSFFISIFILQYFCLRQANIIPYRTIFN